MSSEELRSIGSTGFDHAGGSTPAPHVGVGRSQDEDPPVVTQDDQIQLRLPDELTLQLLRERVLEHSRVNLRLDKPQIHFAAAPLTPMESYVGRLLSDQNLLAATRRGRWPEARIDAAIEDGMTAGLEETLEILFELDKLTDESWGQIRGVLAEFHRKVESTLPRE